MIINKYELSWGFWEILKSVYEWRDAQSQREYFRVKTEYRLCGVCGVHNVLLYLTSNSEKGTKTGMMTSSHLLFGALFLSKCAHCLFLFMQKLFSAESLTHRKPTDPSTLKPSTQDQVAMNTSNLRNCLSLFRNYPPNSALLTDFFIKTSPLMNESVFPLSVRVNHPPTSITLHFQISQFVPGTFPNLRHHPKQARCPRLNVQLFKVLLFFLVTDRRKKENVISVRGIRQLKATIFHSGKKVPKGKIPMYSTCKRQLDQSRQLHDFWIGLLTIKKCCGWVYSTISIKLALDNLYWSFSWCEAVIFVCFFWHCIECKVGCQTSSSIYKLITDNWNNSHRTWPHIVDI